MPAYLLNAAFVLVGLMLEYELLTILPHAKHIALRAMLHAVSGLAALLIGNRVGSLFGIQLGLNALTIPVAACLGLPGTALLWTVYCIL